ncbi:MAG: GNAT family N-acetyltransferase [Gammaproteobacteria bacterium]|nr:GNAT family N-acetyltransferase [Gammaproteobacteria bacterium]
MQCSIIGSLEEVSADDWNALVDPDNPFARHEFLIALEHHDAVGEQFGWLPQYLLVHENNQLVAAAPMYLKNNSYGEFVFDWDWARAYQRAGLEYYPKLVVAIPYTPVTGQRILIAEQNREDVARFVMSMAIEHAKSLDVSSLHWLFTDSIDTQHFQHHFDYMMRPGCQFHWHNNSYRDFEDYLSHFTSKKRKQIKRERRLVKEQGVELEILHGNEVSEEQWQIYHDFYRSTFDRKSGYATLSIGFFKEIAQTMPKNIVLVMAKYKNDYVASAFNIRGQSSLYGRHWGCSEEFHSLHFEACYYQGLDYCIEHQLDRFEPGAQGEHKISRGFLPTKTWSAHWIAEPQFKMAINDFLQRETRAMQDYIEELETHSPFKI